MQSTFRIITASLLALPLAFAMATTDATDARAQQDGGSGTDAGAANPCGNFDFSNGLSCKIQVSGGCSASCQPLQFEAACTGGCTATPVNQNPPCVDTCGTTCVAQCDPALLDCFAGCHKECDQPTIDMCKAKTPTADCTQQATAQCDVHCKDSCKIKPSNCSEHCTRCCTGSCVTQYNYDCDFSCFAKVKGGCDVACTKPEGGIFCNGQYVNASDVQQCIAYLVTKGVNVDVSARGTATCDLTGCHAAGSGKGAGCAASPGTSAGLAGWLGLGVFAMGAGVIRARRRRK